MECPFCCYLQDYIGQFVNIGFVVNCCLDNATPPVNHVYGAGFIRKSSFYGNSIRLYDSPSKNANVIFTGLCDNIFELHFPQFGARENLDINELKALAEERQFQKEEIANE